MASGLQQNWKRTVVEILVLASLVVTMLYYCFGLYSRSLVERIPLMQTHRGNWSDLYPRWFATRALLIEKRNPYSDEVTRQIQQGFYGRALEPGNPTDPKDHEEFAYPAYLAFLLAPTIWLNFRTVQIGFVALMLVGTGLSVPLWIKSLNLEFSTKALVFATVLALSNYHFLFALKLEQLTLLVQVLVAFAFAALAWRRYALAGTILALACIKPQLVCLIVLWMCVWSWGEWSARRMLLLSYALAMIALIGGANLLLAGWIHYWLAGASQYRSYVSPSLLAIVFGTKAIWLDSALLLVFGIVCWTRRRVEFASEEFNFIVALALSISLLIVPNGVAQYNSLMLIPVILMLLSWYRRGGKALSSVLFIWLAGEWVVAALVVLYAIATGDHKGGIEVPQKLVTFLPLVTALSVAVLPYRHARSRLTQALPESQSTPSLTAV